MSIAAKKRKPSFLGKHHSEETKAKLRVARYKQGNPAKGRKMSEKQRQFMKELWKGRTWSPGTVFKDGMIPWNKGKKGIRKLKPEGYSVLHIWLKYHFGKANRCENKLCPKVSIFYQWAKLKDRPYEKKRENFIMLCGSCHQKYDKSNLNIVL